MSNKDQLFVVFFTIWRSAIFVGSIDWYTIHSTLFDIIFWSNLAKNGPLLFENWSVPWKIRFRPKNKWFILQFFELIENTKNLILLVLGAGDGKCLMRVIHGQFKLFNWVPTCPAKIKNFPNKCNDCSLRFTDVVKVTFAVLPTFT
jgi:hypothetical protein